VIKVLIADDEALVRGGFRMILSQHDDIEIVGEAENGSEAIALATELRPTVILMDIRMPGLDGFEAIRHLLGPARSDARILVVTTFGHEEYLYAALRAGASGFILKTTPPDELVRAVRTVAADEALLAPEITRRLIEDYVSRPGPAGAAAPALEELTERELEVLELIGRGKSNSEIAESLILGEATVKTHVGRIFSKLEVRDRSQAVVVAYESGLITPGK
jgi:DNA-binding NarL/FixJ family response regulator